MSDASSPPANPQPDSQRFYSTWAPRVELSASPQPRFDPKLNRQDFKEPGFFSDTDRSENTTEPQKEGRVHWFYLISWVLEIISVTLGISGVVIGETRDHHFLPAGRTVLIVVYIYKLFLFCACHNNTGSYLLHVMELPTAAEHTRRMRGAVPTLMMKGDC